MSTLRRSKYLIGNWFPSLFHCRLQLYVPKYKHCTTKFLKQVLMQEKSLLPYSKTSAREAPNWPELGIRNMLGRVKKNARIMTYFPDFKEKSPEKSTSRRFFWTILFSVALKFARAAIDEAC